MGRLIRNTQETAKHPWPADCNIQGGGKGGVFAAFFEAFPRTPQTFIRGEGETIADAEEQAWQKYQSYLACSGPNGHEYEPRGYTNGAGFCKHCNMFAANVFTGADLGQFCRTCGTGTCWTRHSDQAAWGNGWVKDPAPREERHWYCHDCDPFNPEREAWQTELAESMARVTGEDVAAVLTRLASKDKE